MKRIVYKQGVVTFGMHPKIARAIHVARDVIWDLALIRLVVTSVSGGEHAANSFHYWGMAVDLRTKELKNSAQKQEFARKVGEALGDEYDVVLESLGGAGEHLHIEWDIGDQSQREAWARHVYLEEIYTLPG